MDSKILEIAKYLKNKITAGEGIDEYNWQEIIDVCNEIERINSVEPVAFTIRDDSGYLYVNRMTIQGCDDDELTNQLNILQKYCPEKQYSITPLYSLDK